MSAKNEMSKLLKTMHTCSEETNSGPTNVIQDFNSMCSCSNSNLNDFRKSILGGLTSVYRRSTIENSQDNL